MAYPIPSSIAARHREISFLPRRSKISPKRRLNPFLVVTLGRPIWTPCFFALSIPAFTRSRISSSSNSAKAGSRFSSSLPMAVEVSNCS